MLKQLGRTCVAALCVSVFASAPAHAAGDRERIQQIVDDLKTRLAIPQTINVTVVRTNPKLFSVAPVEHENGTFLLSVEEDFAQALNEDELTAAVAHELGHVWIYTHFPYLQTEELANDVASRVIDRGTLGPLYDKVWKKAAAD
jgi:Zn-dependent protease with chaperone function